MDFIKILSDGYDKTKRIATSGKNLVNEKIKNKVRDNAYQNALERCKQSVVNPNDLSSDEMGVIVNEEEKKINDNIKDMSFKAVIAFLGLEAILG